MEIKVPRKSGWKFNPFLTRELPKICSAKLECGHTCNRRCGIPLKGHPTSNEDCIAVCNRQCPRGHSCKGDHPCGEPCPVCEIHRKIVLQCGHLVVGPCETGYYQKCNDQCGKKLQCGHQCERLCGEECGPCITMVERTLPTCEHVYEVRCYEKNEPHQGDCLVSVPANIVPECGHLQYVPCRDKNKYSTDKLSDTCSVPCASNYLDYSGCGHPCPGICSTCKNGVFHERCNQPCDRILICGHICESPCSKNCLPCSKACITSCEHSVCNDPCGVPCAPCNLPCSWFCPHLRCTLTCDEVCDRDPCNVPCPKTLRCGHPCIGFCGEPCPDLCRLCHKDKLLEGFFDGRTEVEENDRFICLPDCGHIFEVECLNGWMNVEDDNGEINMKKCPLCRTVIWTCRRYNAMLNRKRKELYEVKVKIYGEEKQIEEIQYDALRELLLTCNSRGFFNEYRDWLNRQLSAEEDEIGQPIPLKMCMAKAENLKAFALEWASAEEKFGKLSSKYAEEEYNVLEHYYRQIWHMTKSRELPLSLTEAADLGRELDRVHDLSQLMDRKTNERSPGFRTFSATPNANELYLNSLSWVSARCAYTPTCKENFKKDLQVLDKALKCELGLTENERKMIVGAFGSDVGRWFKCKNGHIYVVTECGGPTEVGKCNICGDLIGGTQHRAVDGTQLAIEMDGAEIPLYPTALVTGLDLGDVVLDL